jgi:hypothetical protein
MPYLLTNSFYIPLAGSPATRRLPYVLESKSEANGIAKIILELSRLTRTSDKGDINRCN